LISVLVIDDDEVVRETLAVFFDTLGYRAYAAATAAEGRQAASVHAPDLVLVDIRLPDATGLALLSALCADDPELGVIMLTGRADIPAAIQSLHSGAIDFLEKPIDLESLELVVRRAAELVRLRREVLFFRSSSWEGELPASTEKLIGEASENSDVPILIAGEQGTGKEFLARRIHDRSRRSSQPFVRMKVASSGADRFESALFGRERGVVAASTAAHRGLLEIAGSGTVFLK
jgi:DNA-binding NtrC family response regulator